MATLPKLKEQPSTAKHPARPKAGRPNIAELHAKLAKRFPKVLAELAK